VLKNDLNLLFTYSYSTELLEIRDIYSEPLNLSVQIFICGNKCSCIHLFICLHLQMVPREREPNRGGGCPEDAATRLIPSPQLRVSQQRLFAQPQVSTEGGRWVTKEATWEARVPDLIALLPIRNGGKRREGHAISSDGTVQLSTPSPGIYCSICTRVRPHFRFGSEI
jgi:hypothetical protein